MNAVIEWWLARTPHQLEVIRTTATVFGNALLPLLGFLLGWSIKLLRATRLDAHLAKEQTAHTEYVNGEPHSVSVVNYARHAAEVGTRAMHAGEASQHETAYLSEWVRGQGRRRQPTSEVPVHNEWDQNE